jgi:hypothetical protein
MLTRSERDQIEQDFASALAVQASPKSLITVIFGAEASSILLQLPGGVSPRAIAAIVINACLQSRWTLDPPLLQRLLQYLVDFRGLGALDPVLSRVKQHIDPTPPATPPAKGGIFISYRRQDTDYPAAWLFGRLADHFGRDRVFKDVDSIPLGEDFVEAITSAVGACDVLLALIGRLWLTITDEDGRRRLDNLDDIMRLEIETALKRKVRVVPILIEGVRIPQADQLPDTLAALTRRQALELSPNRFDFDSGRLIRELDEMLQRISGQDTRRGQRGAP